MMDIRDQMPAVALRGVILLPGMVAHFDVSRKRSVHAVEQAMMGEQKLFLAAQKEPEQEEPALEDLYRIGIVAEVKQVIKLQNNIVRVLVEGLERAELSAIIESEDFLYVEAVRLNDEEEEILPEVGEAMVRSLKETVRSYGQINLKQGKALVEQIASLNSPDELIKQVGNHLPLPLAQVPTAIRQHSIIPIRQPPNKFMCIRQLCRLPDFRICRIQPAITDIFLYGIRK